MTIRVGLYIPPMLILQAENKQCGGMKWQMHASKDMTTADR